MAERDLQPEGSHVNWPHGVGFPTGPDDGVISDEFLASLHRINGVRLPNDEFVRDEAVTLEEMQRAGAV